MRLDMSPRAIAMRLKQVSQLRKICLSLAKATHVSMINPSSDRVERGCGIEPPVESEHNDDPTECE